MILALQTADATTHAWLFTDAKNLTPTATLEWDSGRDLSEQLLGRLTDFLQSHRHSLSDLTGIAIFSGPGSFTSLRIGHAIVNALADSLAIPVAGAQGENWLQDAKAVLKTIPAGHPAWPHYGAEAHITRPKS
jgi:tRNA threonylcarbamoyladenosine biosynthesis protein TsaB